jgi:hypothetical protein
VAVSARQTLLAVLVDQDDHTLEEICDNFYKSARDNGEDATLSVRTIRRYMAGECKRGPRPAVRRVMRIFWGFPAEQLLAPPPVDLFTNHSDRLPARRAVSIDPDRRADNPAEYRESEVMSELERQVTMSARRSARFTTFAENSNIGPEAVDQLRDEVTRLANDYIHEPLVSIMGDLIETQEFVFGLLEGKQKPALTKDLYALAGIVSGLIAKASHDLGRAHDAMTHARAMYVSADNADHTGLRAWARGLQSLIAYWAGRPQEAVRYAAAGADIAANLTGSVTAWLPALHARALAQLPDPGQAREAIGRALDQRDRVRPDDLDEIGGLLTFPRAKQHYYAAGAYVFLGDGDIDAEREAQTALDLYDHEVPGQRSFSDVAGARAELALARVHAGQLDGAREPLAAVLELPPILRIGGIVASVSRVHWALGAPVQASSITARDLRDEIEAFCRVPASALPA